MHRIMIVLFSILFLFGCTTSSIGPLGSTHEHATFKVFLQGKLLDFSKPKYMVIVQEVHLEELNGDIIHKHATGITIGYFLNTLGFKLGKDCFVSDEGKSFCNAGDKKLKFYVDGVLSDDFGDHEISEGAKYLVSYGNESVELIEKQLSSVVTLNDKVGSN